MGKGLTPTVELLAESVFVYNRCFAENPPLPLLLLPVLDRALVEDVLPRFVRVGPALAMEPVDLDQFEPALVATRVL